MSKSFFICGLVRDVAKTFVRNYTMLRQYFATHGHDTYWYFYENDSLDSTPETLMAYADAKNHPNFHCDLNVLGARKWSSVISLQRVRDMCYYRNHYLHRLRQLGYAFDYTLIVDMDFTTLSVEHLDIAMSYNADMVGANGLTGRRGPWPYYDCWALKGIPRSVAHALTPESPRVKVQSCFGGMGLYKTSSLQGCWYDQETNNYSHADHGTLHEAMLHAGHTEMYICPKWVITV